jgi:hypothetical protein
LKGIVCLHRKLPLAEPLEEPHESLDLTAEHPILSESDQDPGIDPVEDAPKETRENKEELKEDGPVIPHHSFPSTSSCPSSASVPVQPIQYPLVPNQVPPQDPMTFMYVSMLQQQITALQTQLLSKPNPPLEKKIATRTIGVNTELPFTTTSIGTSTDPLPTRMDVGVNTEVEMNAIDENSTPRASPELRPFLASTKIAEWDEGLPKTESSIPIPTEPSIPIPPDTGSNYKALFEFEDPSKSPSIANSQESDISFAQKVIPQLVSNAEQSFVYREDEHETMGPNVFNKPFHSFVEEEESDGVQETIAKQMNEFTLDLPTKSTVVDEMSSLPELSLSFDSVNYLKKYGLS